MKECKIVQDLLPNYIENLTSKETTEYVKEHLKTCENCTNIFNNMREDLKVEKATPKVEIDYMKKVKTKMRIADKLALIILLLIIILLLLFWREAFSFICYADICNKYLELQDEIQATGKYTVNILSNGSKDAVYHTKEILANKTEDYDGNVFLSGNIAHSNIENSIMFFHVVYNEKMPENNYVNVWYNSSGNFDTEKMPYYPSFSFDKKYTFWELMSTFTEIRGIRIVDDNYEIDLKSSGSKFYLYRGKDIILRENGTRYILEIGYVPEEYISLIDLDKENVVLTDFEAPNRNVTEKTNKKLSNCDEEAGTVVSYDFKITNEEGTSLKYLGETQIDNIREIKVTNNVTYKKIQERWAGLRDLTDEDFINYSAIIIVNTDKTKEINYKNVEYDENLGVLDIYITEKDATSDYSYSASLIIVPNNMIYSKSNYNDGYSYEVHIAE